MLYNTILALHCLLTSGMHIISSLSWVKGIIIRQPHHKHIYSEASSILVNGAYSHEFVHRIATQVWFRRSQNVQNLMILANSNHSFKNKPESESEIGCDSIFGSDTGLFWNCSWNKPGSAYLGIMACPSFSQIPSRIIPPLVCIFKLEWILGSHCHQWMPKRR